MKNDFIRTPFVIENNYIDHNPSDYIELLTDKEVAELNENLRRQNAKGKWVQYNLEKHDNYIKKEV